MDADPRTKQLNLSSDLPITDPALDRLGHSQFAEQVARGILQLPNSEGLVIGLYGAWGAGKTTTLNYIAHFLRRSPPENQPVILWFNPWWFSGKEDLVRAFFQQLRAELGGLKYQSSALLEKLGNLADLASDVQPQFKLFARLLKRKAKTVPELKKEIADLLQRQAKRIVVLIDDVDRLTPQEMREVFRAVKAIADFPHVTYLLAFDKNVVISSLDRSCDGNGGSYLEKIVQVPFELPQADRFAIHKLFFERLDSILSTVETKRFDKTYWGNIFHEGISKFLETPRDVIRMTNALSVTFGAISEEVNPIDFIAIETLRVFCPDVYDVVRSNREMFAGDSPTDFRWPTRSDLAKFHNEWIKGPVISNPRYADPVQAMLKRLFPRFNSVWENIQYGPEWEARWRLDLRVCAEYIFPVYFSFAVPRGQLSNAEIRSILAEAQDQGHFSERLRALAGEVTPDGKGRLSGFLDRLQDYTQTEISEANIEPIVVALFDIGDELVIPGQMGLVGFTQVGNDILMAQITWQLLKRVDQDARFRILERAFREGKAMYMMQQAVIVLGQQQGQYPEQQAEPKAKWLVSPDQLTELEKLFVGKIRAFAQTGDLLSCPGLPWVLNFWRRKTDEAEVKRWVSETVAEDTKLVRFLEKFLQSAGSFSPGNAVAERHDRLDPQWLRPYLDPDLVAARAGAILQRDSLTDRQRRALTEFMKEYRFRKSGGKPDNPLGFANLTRDNSGGE